MNAKTAKEKEKFNLKWPKIKNTLTTVLLRLLKTDPDLIDHSLLKNGLNGNTKIRQILKNAELLEFDDKMIEKVRNSGEMAYEILKEFCAENERNGQKGYILVSSKDKDQYLKVLPIKYEQFEKKAIIEFENINSAVFNKFKF